MSKVKTRSAAKKRFKKMGKRLVKRSQAYCRHLLTKKTAKKKRELRKGTYVCKADIVRILKLLPY
ncbi:50S ribosomal protein L35 [Candidatus Dependentiae bacterium]|nr:50S ribosomal protein L35 [Candidatus Dependentiae bacterium]